MPVESSAPSIGFYSNNIDSKAVVTQSYCLGTLVVNSYELIYLSVRPI